MEATQPKEEEEEWNGRMTASGVGQKNEDILRCVLVLDKEFRDRNVPFVRFPGIASVRPSARSFVTHSRGEASRSLRRGREAPLTPIERYHLLHELFPHFASLGMCDFEAFRMYLTPAKCTRSYLDFTSFS